MVIEISVLRETMLFRRGSILCPPSPLDITSGLSNCYGQLALGIVVSALNEVLV